VSFAVNETVGDFECLGIVEKPRVGLTYKVRNRRTGEIESLRALSGAAADDPEAVERLLREIRIQARLTHPNLIGFHDAFLLDGHIVMTTDYVDGTTLAECCAAGPLDPEDAVRVLLAVLHGLADAHDLGIAHRGITADHVIFCSDGVVKLGGFDAAKASSDANLTKVGAVIGDPRYISPEQVAGKQADTRSDVYSLGVVLFLALTGTTPFTGKTDFDVLSKQLKTAPPRPSSINPMILPAVEAVVMKALSKKPEERFEGGAAFFHALYAAAAPADFLDSTQIEVN